MKQLACEMCGGNDLIKQDGVFVCQNCGMKYSVEEAKKLMIEGVVEVQGTVKVDNSAFVQKYLQNAHRALLKQDWEEVEKYYNMVEQNSPDNMEAVFFSSYGKAMLSMTDSDYFKREQKFEVLNRSISVISDYYDTTTENKEEAIKLISKYIDKMYEVTYVYKKKNVDISIWGVINALSTEVGDKEWCVNLLDTTKKAFLNEIWQISRKHDDQFIIDLWNRYNPQRPIRRAGEVVQQVQPNAQQQVHPNAQQRVQPNTQQQVQPNRQQVTPQPQNQPRPVAPPPVQAPKAPPMQINTQDQIDTENENEKSDGGCYVATAVYGSYDCPEVWTLRRYRDNTLAQTWYGRAFVRTYYAISPTLVKWFGHTEWFKKMWQSKLDRMVEKLQENGVESTPYNDIIW